MCTDILEQSISAETRRAIFLNDRLAAGHQLERFIDGVWLAVSEADTVDVMVNPNDYRVKLRSIAANADAYVPLPEVATPVLEVVQGTKPSYEQVRTNRLIDRLRQSMRHTEGRSPSYAGA